MPNFHNTLRELRKAKGITQKAAAVHLGITEQAYQKYEYGMRASNHETTIALANFFDAPG